MSGWWRGSRRRRGGSGGRGWGGVDIGELIQHYGIARHVIELGKVDNQQLQALYQHAHALLMPSLYEGFGLPIIESMAFGVPVVSSNISSMPEVVGDGGLLVDPLSIEQISTAIVSIAADRQLHAELCVKAKAQAKRFSWDKAAQSTLLEIERVLESAL